MKIFRQITSNWDENQVEILRQHHIKVEMGINRFSNRKKITWYDYHSSKEVFPP